MVFITLAGPAKADTAFKFQFFKKTLIETRWFFNRPNRNGHVTDIFQTVGSPCEGDPKTIVHIKLAGAQNRYFLKEF